MTTIAKRSHYRAIHSDAFVQKAMQRTASGQGELTTSAKVKILARLRDDPNGIEKLGSSMVGPITLKLRYEGLVRNVLLEDPLQPGVDAVYDVFDDLGQAYILNPTDGEVRIEMFEGKRVRPKLFRVATFPNVRKSDLTELRINIVEQAQDESKQAIMKQEDGHLMTILQAALTDYAANPAHVVSPTHTITEASANFTSQSLYAAASVVEEHELVSRRVLMNVADHRDMFSWDLNMVGNAKLDARVAGSDNMSTFGEFTVQKSIMVPKGTVWVLPEPNYLGVMPVRYSLDTEPDNQAPRFTYGWVMDEMIGMVIVNPRGIAKITI